MGNEEAERMSEVQQELEHLQHGIDGLSEAIAQLEKRCQSALSPTIRGKAIDETKSPQLELCPLADQLRAHVVRIRGVGAAVRSITERIEL